MTQRQYNFEAQHGKGRGYERTLDEHFGARFHIRAANSRHHQRMGIDRFFRADNSCRVLGKSQSQPYWFSVEYKTDVLAESTGKVFVEIQTAQASDPTSLRLGWSCKIMAQVLILYFPASRTIWWCHPFLVKSALPRWREVFLLSPWTLSDDGFGARGILVPRADFFSEVGFDQEIIRR